MNKKVFYCTDRAESIFTAIYDAWSSRYGHDNIEIRVLNHENQGNMELFCEYIYVTEEEEKVTKVIKAIKEKISPRGLEVVLSATCSCDPEKGDAIYRFLILGFSMGHKILDYTTHDVVLKIFNMNRNVSNETHHYKGFARFIEIEEKILLGKITPKNDIIRLLAPHFTDRLGMENFIIYDENRKTAIIHKSGYPWVYTNAEDLDLSSFSKGSKEEVLFSNLWKTFFHTIAIEERNNLKLQRNNIPLRYRNNMLEFGNP
ncbi:MAG: TIGR03915 family putative DNA repair protein [Anaerocolumna sp.]